MQPVQYRLVVRRGPQPNQHYDLNRDTLTIGRDITNDIVINDPEVSRHHSRLVRTASGFEVEDLRSTNGTFVNRQRVTNPVPLTDGDLLGFGETVTLAFEAVHSRAPAAAPQAPGEATVVGPPQHGVGVPPSATSPNYGSPPPREEQSGYDYYEDDEAAPDRNRMLVIGCAALVLVFFCALVAAGIFVDQYEDGRLYCEIPVMRDTTFFCDR